MPTDAEQLALIKSQTLALLVEITAHPKPSYKIDGQQVSWNDYLKQLLATAAWCDAKLAGGDPFEFATQACT